MEYSLPKELDFRLEGENAMRAKEYFSHIPELPLVIPEVIWAKKRILVMEKLSGARPDNLEFLDSNGIDRDEVSAALSRIFNEMIFGKDAPLHCDPHGGNRKSQFHSRKISSLPDMQLRSARTRYESATTSTSSSTTTVYTETSPSH
jgi:predicted unusual protein kinase regulating ubiquinone biosynthesis (AarF/ABC1/UbiB family)